MKKKEPKTLGGRVRSIRSDLTQAEFAEIVGIKQAMVSRYEANKETPSPRILLRITQYSGHSIEWLLTGQDPLPVQISRTKGKKGKAKANHHMKTKDLVEIATEDLRYIKLPETDEFIEMMKDLFNNRNLLKSILEYYRFLKYQDKTKSKK